MRLRLRVQTLSAVDRKGSTSYHVVLRGEDAASGRTATLVLEGPASFDYLINEWVEIDATKPTVRS